MKKEELLDKMRAGHAHLDEVLQSVSDEQMLVPRLHGGWSAKDLLAHFGYWEHWMAECCRLLQGGDTPVLQVGEYPVDEINAQVFTDHQDQSLAEVRRFEKESYLELLEQAEEIAEEDLVNPQRFAWLKGAALEDWIDGNSSGHYEEHQSDLAVFEAL
jgi:hypothetical protein